jgi:hypothetical protein
VRGRLFRAIFGHIIKREEGKVVGILETRISKKGKKNQHRLFSALGKKKQGKY